MGNTGEAEAACANSFKGARPSYCDRCGNVPCADPVANPIKANSIAQMVADGLAKACVSALKSGDVDKAKRMADAQECVAEIFPRS